MESDSNQGEEFYEIASKIENYNAKISRHGELLNNHLPWLPLFKDIWNIHPGMMRINGRVRVQKVAGQFVYKFPVSHIDCNVAFSINGTLDSSSGLMKLKIPTMLNAECSEDCAKNRYL